ncbi:hypothetical protein NPX13_g5924 [Xylaria arbuscula]|uniref:Uncharacterized protein n=1 Tax=Xylaria arbuscula TaxID=114810 RepID=A0A9W8TMN6_9PEZI|nr:hypothetical protein NPX13_g5924 [Xylaria arbuscula]
MQGDEFFFKTNALTFAVEEGDIRLVRILLDAGAELNRLDASFLLQRVLMSSMHEDTALELAQLFISHDTGVDIFPALIIAIAKCHNHLAMFFVKRASRTTAPEQLISYCVKTYCERRNRQLDFYDEPAFRLLKIDITLLHIAIVAGNTRMAEHFLSTTLAYTSLGPNKIWKDLLMVACFAGDRSIIDKLVMLKVDWDGTWPLNISPLVATAWNPDIEIARMIFQCGAFSSHDIAYRLPSSATPLPIHVAARSGNSDFVRWCINSLGMGLDVQFITKRPGYIMEPHIWFWLVPSKLTSPFQLALESGDTATIMLCQHAKLLGEELTQALRLGDEKLISELVLRERDITCADPYGKTLLEAAAEAGNYDMASLYFSSGGEYRSSALLKAVKAALISHDNSVILLLATNRPLGIIDKYEASAIVIAIQQQQLGILIILLGDNFLPGSVEAFLFPINLIKEDSMYYRWSGQSTPLRAAFFSGDTELIERLMQRGYRAQPEDLNYNFPERSIISLFVSHFPPTSDDSKWTRQLLFRSITADIVELVRDCITCVDSLEYYVESKTPLQQAVEWNKQTSIKLLIDAGADINTPAAAYRGATALQLAAMRGSINIARLLLERGADVNAPPAKFHGRTALEGASEHGRLDVTQLLLENGVRLDGAMRIHYIRAVAYASREGHIALATLLKKFGRWTDRDQEVYAREDILWENQYFVFDEENQDWYFQNAKQKWHPETETYECNSTSGSPTFPSSTHGSDSEYSLNGEESRCDLGSLENKESGSQDRSAQKPDDELGLIKQEQDVTGINISQREREDMGLLMERYLREDCRYNWDNIQDDEYGAQNPYMEAADSGFEQTMQDQGNNDDNYISWWQAEDLDMMTVAERYNSLYR